MIIKYKYRIRYFFDDGGSFTMSKHRFYLTAKIALLFNKICRYAIVEDAMLRDCVRMEKFSYRKTRLIQPPNPWPTSTFTIKSVNKPMKKKVRKSIKCKGWPNCSCILQGTEKDCYINYIKHG